MFLSLLETFLMENHRTMAVPGVQESAVYLPLGSTPHRVSQPPGRLESWPGHTWCRPLDMQEPGPEETG